MHDDPFEISANYGEYAQARLEQVIATAPARRTGLVIRKLLEDLVLAERIARDHGVEINDREKRQIMHREHDDVQAEVDRAVGEFIGSIVSAEGG